MKPQGPVILLCLIIVGVGKADWPAFRLLALDWSLSNMAVLIVLGIPAASLLTPLFRERGGLVAGWWR